MLAQMKLIKHCELICFDAVKDHKRFGTDFESSLMVGDGATNDPSRCPKRSYPIDNNLNSAHKMVKLWFPSNLIGSY